jgi:hypothetical protein
MAKPAKSAGVLSLNQDLNQSRRRRAGLSYWDQMQLSIEALFVHRLGQATGVRRAGSQSHHVVEANWKCSSKEDEIE